MITDSNLLLDAAAALTTSRASSNVIDLGVSRDLGQSHLELAWQFITLPTAAGAATVTVAVQTSPDNSTWTTLLTSDVMPITAFTATAPWGYFRPQLPLGVQRYVRLNYTIGTGPLTAGTVTASLVLARAAAERAYPRNYSS